MDKRSALTKIKALIEEGETVLNTSHSSNGVIGGPYVDEDIYLPWRAKASVALDNILPPSQQGVLKELEKKASHHTSLARQWLSQLEAAHDGIEQGFIAFYDESEKTVDGIIERILIGFSEVVGSIRRRHAGRTSIGISDEYDVQDLLRSVCLAYFDDVRDEESVPSFAGKNSRVDSFLKEESRFIEVKMA